MTLPTCDLERDLHNHITLVERVKSDVTFAESLYAALCNNQFRHVNMTDDPEDFWSCTWRAAGDIVAELTNNPQNDYLTYYCTGNEGMVTPELVQLFAEIGWTARPWPKSGDL